MGFKMGMSDWAKYNIVKDFIPADKNIQELSKYNLEKIRLEDLFFTGEVEDDRINSTIVLKDYDWVTYTWDTRFPVEGKGTLAVRFEYFGMGYCQMYVKQFLPSYVSGLEKNYVKYYEVDFPVRIWNTYYLKDLEARVENIKSNSSYAYNSGILLINFYNDVLENGTIHEKEIIQDTFDWESVRVPTETVN